MSVLDGVPVGRIEERARAARPGVAAASVVTGLLFGIGWLIAKLLGFLWLAAAACWFSVDEGLRAGRSPEWEARAADRRARNAARRAGAGRS